MTNRQRNEREKLPENWIERERGKQETERVSAGRERERTRDGSARVTSGAGRLSGAVSGC